MTANDPKKQKVFYQAGTPVSRMGCLGETTCYVFHGKGVKEVSTKKVAKKEPALINDEVSCRVYEGVIPRSEAFLIHGWADQSHREQICSMQCSNGCHE